MLSKRTDDMLIFSPLLYTGYAGVVFREPGIWGLIFENPWNVTTGFCKGVDI